MVSRNTKYILNLSGNITFISLWFQPQMLSQCRKWKCNLEFMNKNVNIAHIELQLSCKRCTLEPSWQNFPKDQKGKKVFKKSQLTQRKWIFPVLGGVSSATPVSVWPWLSLFHIWCPGKCATCYLGHTTRALHPSTRHWSLLAHAQSHRGPMLTTVLDYDDTFVSEERAALGRSHHYEPISRLWLLLCASGWPTVTNFHSLQLWCSKKRALVSIIFQFGFEVQWPSRDFSKNFYLFMNLS